MEANMLRKLMISASAMIFTAGLASAQMPALGNVDVQKALSESKIAVPSSDQAETVKTKKSDAEWTIMVFVNGKNNLEQFAISDVNEMEMIGSTDKVNIVVEFGRMSGYDTSNGDWKSVRRYLIKKDSDTKTINSPMLEDLGMIDMGSYKSVIDFGKWAKENYPAKKYMLILWNHGAGWLKGGVQNMTRGISYDDQSGNHINTPEEAKILKALGGVDVLGSDACLMQMVEVDYELKDYVPYIVGSEETEPGDGYTYNTFLGPLVKNPSMSPMQLAKVAVEAYSNHYESQSGGYTQSYVKANTMESLKSYITNFATAVMNASDGKTAAVAGRNKAVSYAYAENKDLYDFVRIVVANSKDTQVKSTGKALMNYITSSVVGENHAKDEPSSYYSSGSELSLSKGIAIYVPTRIASGYTDLAWAKASNWVDFLNWMNK